MPELPEVETITRTLAPQVVDRVIAAVHVLHSKTLEAGVALLPQVVPGARVLRAWRRGKLLLLNLASPQISKNDEAIGYILAFHLKMTGRLFVHGLDERPHAHTRMIFDLEPTKNVPGARLFFDDMRTFGYCRLMRPGDLVCWPFWQKLGPEPFSLTSDAFIAAFSVRRSKIKALLLDQSMIAGIGNIYADEACFRSGVRPDTPASELGPGRLAALLAALKSVLAESIEQCGSSIRNYRDANGNAGDFQNSFRVYGRSSRPCTVCGKALQKATIAGRTTVFCAYCQQ